MLTMRSLLATRIHWSPRRNKGQQEAGLGQPFLAPRHLSSSLATPPEVRTVLTEAQRSPCVDFVFKPQQYFSLGAAV